MANRLNRFREQLAQSDDFHFKVETRAHKGRALARLIALGGLAGLATEHPVPIVAGALLISMGVHTIALAEGQAGMREYYSHRASVYRRMHSEVSPADRK